MLVEKRTLGQSGIHASCLGLGTVKFGRNQEVKYPKTFSIPSDKQLEELLDEARELGINLLDTAPAYGSSEQRIGQILTDRSNWILCTKVGEEFFNGKSFYNFSGQHTKTSIERSLKNLNTDYLDLVLVHSDGNDNTIINSTDCFEALSHLKDSGVIRAFGMSTKSVEGGIRAAELCDAVMVTLNPSNTQDIPVIKHALLKNKGVLVKKALNSGHVGGESVRNNLNFAINTPGVTSVIIGTISKDHLSANASIINETFST